jgi:hypothetical protein
LIGGRLWGNPEKSNQNQTIDVRNTKDFLRLGVPLGQATRLATDFISKFILGGGASGSAEFIPLHHAKL